LFCVLGRALLEAKHSEKPRGVSKALTTQAPARREERSGTRYSTSFSDVAADFDPLQWWKAHAVDLPHWSSAAGDVLLVQPSSAAAERVFSLLKATFGPQQDTTLNDYIQTSLMLHYNR
jgi:hypothetical protein